MQMDETHWWVAEWLGMYLGGAQRNCVPASRRPKLGLSAPRFPLEPSAVHHMHSVRFSNTKFDPNESPSDGRIWSQAELVMKERSMRRYKDYD